MSATSVEGAAPTGANAVGELGMIAFLASEAMLFGALVIGLLALRHGHPAGFALVSRRLDLVAGTANTMVLLTSSLLVAIGIEVQSRKPRVAAGMLLEAAGLGLVFLAIKAGEYAAEYRDGLWPGAGSGGALSGDGARLFMDAYVVATALHALHVAIGIALLSFIAWRLRRAPDPDAVLVENVGRYWHLVDIVWLFLFPILYLSR